MLVQPIRYTADPAGIARLLTTLGAVPLEQSPDWSVFGLASGRVALHRADADYPEQRQGVTDLAFLASDLPAAETRLRQADLAVRPLDIGFGPMLVVRAADGLTFTVGELSDSPDTRSGTAPTGTGTPADVSAAGVPGAPGGISVLPLWMTSDMTGAVAALLAVGLRERMASDNGAWVDLSAGAAGGLVAAHLLEVGADPSPRPYVTLSFEFDGDPELLAEHLQRNGFDASVLDENYSRVVILPDPDDPDQQIWLNQAQQDLYGYQRRGS